MATQNSPGDSRVDDYAPTPEPSVPVPWPKQYGTVPCPNCGYRCGCCCHCQCQTLCSTPDEDGDCGCDQFCHGGHEPWDCLNFSTRYCWSKAKSEASHTDFGSRP